MPPLLGVSQATTFNAIKAFNALFPQEGGKAVPVPLNFALQPSFNIDLTLLQQRGFIKVFQSVFVDNSLNASPLTIVVAQSNQNIVIPGNSQAVVPIFVPGSPVFTIACAGGQNATVFFTNLPLPAAVWGAQGGFTFSAGKLSVTDPVLDACVNGTALTVLEEITANNNVIKPFFAADEMFSGTATAAGNTAAIITGNPSFFITEVEIFISGDGAMAAAGENTIKLQDGALLLAQNVVVLPNAAAAGTLAPIKLVELRNLQYNSKANGNALTINIGTALTGGKVVWNIAGGICSQIGP